MEPQPPGLRNRRMGRPRAPPFSPAPPRSSNLGAQAAQRGDGGSAAGQAEAAPRSALLHQGLGERKKGAVCLSLQLTRLRTETGSGACRSEEAEEKEPVVWGLGGWGRPRPGTAYRARCQERWAALAAAGRGSCLPPKTENRGSFILAPCTLARNLTLSVLREPPFSASSQRPPATCLPPPTRITPAIPAKLGVARNVHPGSPSQASPGTYQLWGPKDGARRPCECWGPQLRYPSFSGWRGAGDRGWGVGLPLRPVSLLTCSLTPFLLFVSPLFWSLFLLSERLCLQPHLASPSLIGLLQSLSHSFSPPPPPPRTFPSVFLFLSQIFSPSDFQSLSSSGFHLVLSPSLSLTLKLFLFLSLSVPPTLFPPLPQIPFLSSSPLRFSFLPAGRPASRPRCGLPFQSRLTPPLLASPPTSKPDP
uniref:Uncharacterized protein n=1 Tax=Mustela putorius furo TaxID=9669 RepID=M3Z6M4_MUSPF